MKPVAWRNADREDNMKFRKALEVLTNEDPRYEKKIGEAVKTLQQALMQQKKEWVGLTDEEIWDLGADHAIDLAWAREIEAKLKEKNV